MFPAYKRGWLWQSSLPSWHIRPEYISIILGSGAQGGLGGHTAVPVITIYKIEAILWLVEVEVAGLIY